jgi:hypothetical protein
MSTTSGVGESSGWDWRSAAEPTASVELRTDVAHSARMYDYYLGGKNNFAADRAAAELALTAFPDLRTGPRQNRGFLARATGYLAGQGIRQFLDIGAGLPTSPNLHEVAQEIAPESRVVYVDNDPIVLVHARALLTSAPEGATAYIDADLRDPLRILSDSALTATLDLTRPVALSLVAILHFVPDEDDARGIVATLVDALPSGSYLTLTHITADAEPEVEKVIETYRARGIPGQARGREEVERFFPGLELVDPGVQMVHRWRPDASTDQALTDAQVSCYGAVARKP